MALDIVAPRPPLASVRLEISCRTAEHHLPGNSFIAERYQQGLDYTTRLPGWSMGKSVTASMMGRLLNEKVYDLWQPAPIAEWQKGGTAT